MFDLKIEYMESCKEELKKAKLFTVQKNVNEEVVVCDNFEKAKNFAFFHEKYSYRGGRGYTWGDIIELEMSKIMETVYAQENYKEVNKVLNKISICSEDLQIISKEYYEIWDHVYYMLIECLKNRAILGETDNLYEKMFQAYLSGGWPCGWKGNYPNGKLIIYYPQECLGSLW